MLQPTIRYKLKPSANSGRTQCFTPTVPTASTYNRMTYHVNTISEWRPEQRQSQIGITTGANQKHQEAPNSQIVHGAPGRSWVSSRDFPITVERRLPQFRILTQEVSNEQHPQRTKNIFTLGLGWNYSKKIATRSKHMISKSIGNSKRKHFPTPPTHVSDKPQQL